MMFRKLISRLLGRGAGSTKGEETLKTPSDTSQADIETYYIEEIAASPYIKKSSRNTVLNDFLQKTKLRAGELLSLQEKKALGLNTRFKITLGQYDALTVEGVNLSPKRVLEAVCLRATFNYNRHRDIARMKGIGITQYSPMSCGDSRDCEWCASMNGKVLASDVDFVQLIKENCT